MTIIYERSAARMRAKRTLSDLQSAILYALIELAKGIQGG
jgi:hypothetical protein